VERAISRQFVAASALALGVAGLAASFWFGADAGAQGTGDDQTFEVWIIDSGFNPETCTIRRFDDVRWVNKSSTVRNVTFDRLTLPQTPNEPLSTGDIQPGESTGAYSFDFIGSNPYHDKYTPQFTGSIATTESGVPSCSQQPPTPTPTLTPTATPTATPTPERPAACGAMPGCAVAAAVSRDEGD
jgi:plastocyanin